MKKATIVLIALAALIAGSRTAQAQSDELIQTGFINVDGGAQPQRRTITAESSFPLYDEVASLTAIQRIRNGFIFDASGGVRIGRNLAAGGGFSQFGRAGTGAVTASIPNPDFFDRPLIIARDATNLTHTERTIHGRITWFMPISKSLDASVSGGPSYIHVEQGLATGLTVAPGTQTVTLGNATQSGNALGANAGFDANYMLRPGLGVGLFVRYTYGKLNLPDVKDFKVGGLQSGVGLRARF